MDSSQATTTTSSSSSSSEFSSTTCGSPASDRRATGLVAPSIEVWTISSSEDESGGDTPSDTPIHAVFCIKKKEDIRRFELREDCFIMDFDPLEEVRNISLESETFDQNGIAMVAEKGQVACRDYPHSRHLCQKFPFATTPHDNHCDKCYCYVCDAAAPCTSWTLPASRHCDAERNGLWEAKRKQHRKLKT